MADGLLKGGFVRPARGEGGLSIEGLCRILEAFCKYMGVLVYILLVVHTRVSVADVYMDLLLGHQEWRREVAYRVYNHLDCLYGLSTLSPEGPFLCMIARKSKIQTKLCQ